MEIRRPLVIAVMCLALGACATAPADPAPVGVFEPGPAAVVDEARSVVEGLEERSRFVDSQMRDPFSPP